MQKVAKRRLEIARNPNASDPSRNERVLAKYRKQFSFLEVGARYRERLEAIWAGIG